MLILEVIPVIEDLAKSYDVVVIGGGGAGLSGALMLARARRSVLVIDGGAPRNAPADGVHGFLGHEGIAPVELIRHGQAEVRRYGGHLTEGEVVSAQRQGSGFAVTLADGQVVESRRLLVTTGIVDELPEIPGLKQHWGHEVVHCPYCHGWEVRDQAIGVLALGPMSVHQALLFRQWSSDVMFFSHSADFYLGPGLTEEEAEKFAARGITVVDGEVAAITTENGRLTGVLLKDGSVVPRQTLVIAPRFAARAGFLTGLGLTATEHPMGIGEYIEADSTGLTAVPGVWVAGNVTDPTAQVSAAVAGGARAGAVINADLVNEETEKAVDAYRHPFSAASEAKLCEQVMGDRRHGLTSMA